MQKKVLAIILQLPRKKAKYINQNKVEREIEGVESLKGERPILPPNPHLSLKKKKEKVIDLIFI